MSTLTVMPAAPLGFPLNGMQYSDSRLNSELPTQDDQPWPPTHFNPIQFDFRVWDAWWLLGVAILTS